MGWGKLEGYEEGPGSDRTLLDAQQEIVTSGNPAERQTRFRNHSDPQLSGAPLQTHEEHNAGGCRPWALLPGRKLQMHTPSRKRLTQGGPWGPKGHAGACRSPRVWNGPKPGTPGYSGYLPLKPKGSTRHPTPALLCGGRRLQSLKAWVRPGLHLREHSAQAT